MKKLNRDDAEKFLNTIVSYKDETIMIIGFGDFYFHYMVLYKPQFKNQVFMLDPSEWEEWDKK